MARVNFTVDAGDSDDNMKHMENLIWEHAKICSARSGFEVGSDEFIVMYHYLKYRYTEIGNNYGYIQHVAAHAIRQLSQAGMMVPCDAEDVVSCEILLHRYVSIITAALCMTYAAGPDTWIDNDTWDSMPMERRTIVFITSNITGEPKDYDDLAEFDDNAGL